MSSSTWTAAELLSDARPSFGSCWRVVEAQHFISTAKLTDTQQEQEHLEALIEKSKPAIPQECSHLHYLLATPFRYGAPYPNGSRFRRAGLTLGVFYASELAETAAIEMAFYRLLFFAESPATPWPTNAGEFTAFSVTYATGQSIDLTRPPLVDDRKVWTHLTDHTSCQDLAEIARAQEIYVIKYESVRDPQHKLNIALLSCKVFAQKDPGTLQTWRIHFSPTGVRIIREFPRLILNLDCNTFAADPRIGKMKWIR
jgi:hypothetical protein